MIADVLNSIDKDYRKHVKLVVITVADVLYQITGYHIVTGKEIHGLTPNPTKSDDYFLYNSHELSELRQFSTQSIAKKAYEGLKTLVFFIILNSPGNKVTYKDLLHHLRKIDSRFPETITSTKASTTSSSMNNAIPELSNDFLGLLQQMKKEDYVLIQKDNTDIDDYYKNIVEFGPRFYLEVH